MIGSDFLKLLPILLEHEVRFIVVGGVAGILHGAARTTNDIDVVYERSKSNFERLVNALGPLHPYLRGVPPGLPFKWDLPTIRNGLNFTLITDWGHIDLLGEIAGGGTFNDLLPLTIEAEVYGQKMRCIDLPTLIKVKRAAGRPKDFEAVAELEGILDRTEPNENVPKIPPS